MKRSGSRKKLGILLAITILSAGCETGEGTGVMPTASALTVAMPPKDSPQAVTATAKDPPRHLTWERIKQEWRQALTRDDFRDRFGAPTESGETYIAMNGNTRAVDQDIYVDGDARLVVQWSKSGQLLYAVFYDRDAAGVRRSFLPAIGDMPASSSEDNAIAPGNGIFLDQPARLYRSTNAYEWREGIRAVYSFSVDVRKKYKVVTLSDDFAEVQDESGYGGWVPVWYLTPAAARAEEIEPLVLKVESEAQIRWYPGSNGVAVSAVKGDTLYAYVKYGDWYGVAVPDGGRKDRRFGLLWVRKDDVASGGQAPAWFAHASPGEGAVPSIAAAVRSLLVPGVSQGSVRKIFGPPSFVESSENVAQYDGKVRSLPLWRYEADGMELVIAWTETGTLRYVLYREASGTTVQIGWSGVFPIQDSLVPSLPVRWDWRFRSELAYNFLLDKIGSVLLVAGEDGGFSGMHMNSNVYALDSVTGREIWKYDFGPEMHAYGLSTDQSRIVFLKRFMKEDRPVYQFRAIRTDSGRKLWEKKLDDGYDVATFAVAGNVAAAIRYEAGVEADMETFRYLEAWSLKTGTRLWRIKVPARSDLIRDEGKRNVLLVQTERGSDNPLGAFLTAYDPRTGKPLWRKEERWTASDRNLTDRTRNAERAGQIWTQTADRLILAEAASGTDKLRLPIDDHTHYDIIDGRYAFLHRSSSPSHPIAYLGDEPLESTLIELRTGKKRFTVEGRAEFGSIDGDVLYYRLGGKAMAYDLRKGVQRWGATGDSAGGNPIGGPTVKFGGKRIGAFPTLGSVYVLDDSTGKALKRLSDIRIGYYDFTSESLLQGYLSVIEGKLYVGSSNGFFGKVSVLS
ncbi:PQQ-binding-like beta-propeller repeat protein [Cohnella sp. CFH 77786]|uniref:outer membrane protein assembly factor BamB family protein n=1 Tax=Cohnella sp. CFH 77786 TaxID=2662265 RepID=UPI001C60CB79|nr:PQQ-binding-like beta-propeller repeat protein [Cohnella sp. CFH 77786]MBW5448412.1 PQQ-binding-like beta-propeller repeat protein [Cohnella sp. CFH 77786]